MSIESRALPSRVEVSTMQTSMGSATVAEINRGGGLPNTLLVNGFGVLSPRTEKMEALSHALDSNVLAVHLLPSSRPPGSEIKRKAIINKEILEQKGVVGANAVAVSGGSNVLLEVVHLSPGSISKAVLVTPTGYHSEMSPRMLLQRYIRSRVKTKEIQASAAERLKLIRELGSYLKNVRGARNEFLGLLNTDVDMLCRSAVEKFGLQVALVLAKEDEIFPYREIEARLRESKDIYTSITTVSGGHDEFRGVERMRVSAQLLSEM